MVSHVLIQNYSSNSRPPVKESSRVPAPLSVPRSAVSNVNRVLKAAEGLQLFDNPIPEGVQDTVAILGAGFAAYNIGAELYDRDWKGAVEDTASGAVSLLGGVKLLTDNEAVTDGFSLAGAALNGGLAVRDIRQKKYFDAGIKLATATGLSMTSLGPGGVEAAGLAVLGVSGLVDLTVDQVKKFRKS